jgi:ribonuclease D
MRRGDAFIRDPAFVDGSPSNRSRQVITRWRYNSPYMTAALPPPIWVATPEALLCLVEELRRQPRLAVDTEANSLHAYREQVCLIQFSTPDRDYLLDPLALPDLSALAPIFSNPNIEKVFHAAEYDLIGLRRDFGLEVCSIFDTMQAARLLGYRQVGLEAMLTARFACHTDKRYQRVDWARRPLLPEWLDYARRDTHYLLPLREALWEELKACGREALAREEFARLARGKNSSPSSLPLWQRLPGARHLDERHLAILKELCLWREREAQRLNRPCFKVVGEKTLVDLARLAPQTRRELENAGLTDRQIHCFGEGILQAVQRGRAGPPLPHLRPKRPDPAYVLRLERLRRWRQSVGQQLGIDSGLILPREFLYAIVECPPQSLEELSQRMPDSPWRLEHFGQDILRLVRTAP